MTATVAAACEEEPAEAPDTVISAADELHTQGKSQETLELLQSEAAVEVSRGDENSVGELSEPLAWRLGRAFHDVYDDSDDEGTRETMLRDGLAVALEAYNRYPESGPCAKWYGIVLGKYGDYLPTKEKVANSYVVRDALSKAAELIPEDSSVQQALGQWTFKVAGISWVERNAAKLLFGEPPSASYEDAAAYFEAAYRLRASKKSAFFRAKTGLKLGEPAELVRDWLARALDVPAVGEGDLRLDQEILAAQRDLQ